MQVIAGHSIFLHAIISFAISNQWYSLAVADAKRRNEVDTMSRRVLGIICAIAFGLLTETGMFAFQDAQPSNSPQTTAAVKKTASGGKSITGCVAREGESFVLKTDEGTYEFDTARDLSKFVGKKVKITGQWSATGVATAAPMAASANTETTETSSSAKNSASSRAFVGNLHLHITGDVVGDCTEAK